MLKFFVLGSVIGCSIINLITFMFSNVVTAIGLQLMLTPLIVASILLFGYLKRLAKQGADQ